MSVSPIIDGNVIYIEIVLPDIQNVIYSLPATSVGIVSFIVMYRILVIFARGLNFLPQFKIRVKIKGGLILRFILFSIYVRVKL